MKPASTSARKKGSTKLMVLSHRDRVDHSRVRHLGDFLEAGDLIVVNTSATLPASFRGQVERSREPLELRLASYQGPRDDRLAGSPRDLSSWLAVVFGDGTWKQATEARGNPPDLQDGDRLRIGTDLHAKIVEVDRASNRLVRIQFESKNLEHSLYEYGKPIQYSYLREQLQPWDQQTIFSGPPISVEPPSATFPFTWGQAFGLQKAGIGFVPILHGAGISTTGDDSLDGRLPFPEYFEIPPTSAEMINRAVQRGTRIVALGTTVARALESSAEDGFVGKLSGLTNLKIAPGLELQIVQALISGMHEPGTSHFELQKVFCNSHLISRGHDEAAARGYKVHEYGDLTFLTCTPHRVGHFLPVGSPSSRAFL